MLAFKVVWGVTCVWGNVHLRRFLKTGSETKADLMVFGEKSNFVHLYVQIGTRESLINAVL